MRSSTNELTRQCNSRYTRTYHEEEENKNDGSQHMEPKMWADRKFRILDLLYVGLQTKITESKLFFVPGIQKLNCTARIGIGFVKLNTASI